MKGGLPIKGKAPERTNGSTGLILDRVHADQDFGGQRLRAGYLGDFQNTRTAERLLNDGAHDELLDGTTGFDLMSRIGRGWI